MREFDRRILYLYHYRSDRKQNNVGFAKIEVHRETVRIRVKLRMRSEHMPESVILYELEKGKMKELALQGVFPVGQANEGEILIDTELYERAHGIYLPMDELNFVGARIDEKDMSMPRQETKEEVEFVAAEQHDQKTETKEKVVSPTSWGKIGIEDMGTLPVKEWSYAQNSFMLAKYERYGFLMYGDIDGQEGKFLGVPGEFNRRDSYLANVYGFEFFKKEIGEGKPQIGDFGYWLHRVNMVQ